MEFLKAFFGDKAITYDELVQAINAYNGDEKNKEKLIKMVNLIAGKHVLVTDRFTVTGSAADAVFSTYLFGEGAFLSCDKKNYENQYTINYDPEASAGIDKFYTKQGKVLHPNGLSLLVDNIAKDSPTFAELGASANYELKFNSKNVKMGVIKSKVGTAVV